jgi:glycogen debranching enzyme
LILLPLPNLLQWKGFWLTLMKMRIGRTKCRDLGISSRLEWLETNATGGFAMGTVSGLATRRYHGLLIAARKPPAGRRVLFARVEEHLESGGTGYELGLVQYPGHLAGRGHEFIESFEPDPPRWTYRCGEARVEKSMFLLPGRAAAVLRYVCDRPAVLRLRPFFASRGYHALQQAESGFHAPLEIVAPGAVFCPSEHWYHGHEYALERERGLDFGESLWTPGVYEYALRPGEPVWFMASCDAAPADLAAEYEARIRRPFHPAHDFLARRGSGGWALLAGFPWFAEWGRDAMIALPGLLLGNRPLVEEARSILSHFAGCRAHGLVANRFDDESGKPEYNSADATLWWFIASHQYLMLTGDDGYLRGVFLPAARDILDHFLRGTVHDIGVDPLDSLLSTGNPSTQLTWMDARVNGVPVTPRHGKAVELNALYYNALRITARWARRGDAHEVAEQAFLRATRVRTRFREHFWRPADHCLRDTSLSDQLRPNQILAVSLPYSPLELPEQRAVVRAVFGALFTPFGLRTLAPTDAEYRGRYEGGVESRDSAYHQGTAWPWLLGHYFEAMLKAFGRSPDRLAWVRSALDPLDSHRAAEGCLGSIAEVFDGDAPQRWNGAPAQAWSVAEFERAHLLVRGAI